MEARNASTRTPGSVGLTIVGGRPSEDGSGSRGTPRGLEVLLKKASVDAEFRALLLRERSRAGRAIALELDPAETAMLDSMPSQQLEAIIRGTRVREEDRRVFLGKVASVMLAALGTGVSGCPRSLGSRPAHLKQRVPTGTKTPREPNATGPSPKGAGDQKDLSQKDQARQPDTNEVVTPPDKPRAFSAGIRANMSEKTPAKRQE